jgi:nitroreductase
MSDLATVRAILDLARWAPSGDNTQPWRFEIRSGQHLVVHGFDTRSHCVYDLDGHSSQLAIGGLLESIRIAASAHGLAAREERRIEAAEMQPTFDIRLIPDPGIPASKLIPYLRTRSVQRRALQTRPLTSDEKTQLEASVGPGYRVRWREGFKNRARAARLMWRNARLRLTIPEAFEVHRSIIHWEARFSDDRIPDQALGANPLTTRLMRFAMQSWPRVAFMNRWLGGTIAPRVELDLVPSLACAAHFLIAAASPCRSIDDYLAAGGAMQRFWLTATSLGLQVQPEMTPLIFARYASEKRDFSRIPEASTGAQTTAIELERLFDVPAGYGAFMGRIGAGRPAQARSLRLPLERLLIETA